MTSPDPLLARLARLDTCAVSDALDQLGLPSGVNGLPALSAGRRIAGAAVTVQLDNDDGRPSRRHLCTAAVDASGPGKVIVIAHNGRTDVAGWGGILSRGASRNAVEGIVIDGACRDLDESRDLGLTIYGRAATAVTARSRVIETDWDVPVTVAGRSVAPGDLVLADGSGVVFLPLAHAEDVLGRAERIAARERLMVEQVERGLPMTEVMGADYETQLKDAGQ